MVRAIGFSLWKPQYTQELLQELVIYRGMNIDIVRPNLSRVYLRERRAMVSR